MMVLLIVLIILILVVVAIDIYTLINDWYHTKRVESGLRTLYKRIRKLEDQKMENGYTEAIDPTYLASWSISKGAEMNEAEEEGEKENE